MSSDEHVELVAGRLIAHCSRMRQRRQLQSNDKVLRGRREVEISGKVLWSSRHLQYLCSFMTCCCCECWMPTELSECEQAYIRSYWIRAKQLLANESQDQSHGFSRPIIAKLILANHSHSAPYISLFTFTQPTVVI